MTIGRMRVVAWGLVVACVTALLMPVVQPAQTASALSGADFDPGSIISDGEFFDANALSEAQVQAFLESQVPNCIGANGYTCLKNYSVDTFSRGAVEPGHCDAYTGATNEPASRIIFKVAQACGISPKVLIVTLQKEQGLVTASSPTERQYRVAMGYGCPDTSDCDAQFYGFYNQVYKAAWQFRQYTNYPSRQYRIGNISVGYHPNASCGSSIVNIRNQATANLYNYTPYQPNAAALANLGGTGDSCSSYGNRNFWVYFNNWFGSPNDSSSPIASLDVVQASPGTVRLAGWAFDPDTSQSIYLHVYINGVGFQVLAGNNRPDVGATWPSAGPYHGFDASLPMQGEGPQTVCIYGINLGPGQNKLFGCPVLPGMTGSPSGVIDAITAVGDKITVTGWVYDPDTVASAPVHIYVDGDGYAYTADDDRPDFGSTYPAYGPKHGYSRTMTASPGIHNVCVYGINIAGGGQNKQIGCRTVTVHSGSPYGVVDSVTAKPGSFTVTGWTFDPDSAASTPVHVYANANGVAGAADQSRPDVASAYPGYGDKHGYSVTVPASPEANTVCAYGIDIAAPGGNRVLACRVVQGMSGPPVGVIDSVTASNGVISVAGWAYDPDTADPVPVHVYVDSSGYAFMANRDRPDLAAVYPAYGAPHGYSEAIPSSPGSHQVCIYGINMGPGDNKLIGCRTVIV
ncbi:hypothetical protein [Luethyella okanaganae]|uniref:Hemagglutinin n=1 Tax=Luethyella okanaganae TaxID=69372 RepID=A0ABW1VCR2_9MICO